MPTENLGDELDGVAELFLGLDFGWGYDGISALFDGLSYNKMSHFQRKVHKVMKVFRIHGGQRDPLMKGRILGSSTNKYLNFIADTGSPIAIIPKGVAVKNKLSIMPTDEDEPSYAGVNNGRLTVVGQCHMFIHFKDMKSTKQVRAIVCADDGDEVIIGLQTLVEWGIIPECFTFPMRISDKVGTSRDMAFSFVRTVKETTREAG